jgi:hypothetical protein
MFEEDPIQLMKLHYKLSTTETEEMEEKDKSGDTGSKEKGKGMRRHGEQGQTRRSQSLTRGSIKSSGFSYCFTSSPSCSPSS